MPLKQISPYDGRYEQAQDLNDNFAALDGLSTEAARILAPDALAAGDAALWWPLRENVATDSSNPTVSDYTGLISGVYQGGTRRWGAWPGLAFDSGAYLPMNAGAMAGLTAAARRCGNFASLQRNVDQITAWAVFSHPAPITGPTDRTILSFGATQSAKGGWSANRSDATVFEMVTIDTDARTVTLATIDGYDPQSGEMCVDVIPFGQRLPIKSSRRPLPPPASRGGYDRATITVPASGVAWQNTTGRAANVVIVGGTVSDVAISRGGSTYDSLGVARQVNVAPGEFLKITYSAAPTAFLYPLLVGSEL